MFFMGLEFSGTTGYRSLFPFIDIKCMAGNPEVKEKSGGRPNRPFFRKSGSEPVRDGNCLFRT
jgi:hypothetical protein